MDGIALGLNEGMANAAYHLAPGESKSRLDKAAKSLAHYYECYEAPDREPFEQTTAMLEGSICHDAFLEPESFASRYIVAPEDAPRRPTDRQINAKKPSNETLYAIDYWRNFGAASDGKTIITPEQYEMGQRVAQALRKHPKAGPLFTEGVAEQAYFAIDPETGALIKCKPDWRRPGDRMIVDLKTTADAGEDEFGRSAFKYRYPVQGGWYPHVIRCATGEDYRRFVFVAIEKVPPFAIGIYYMTADDFRQGMALARRDLRRIVEARATGHWPDHGDEPKPLKIPGWARKQWDEAA